jgi:excisionase family DNA binding protein
MAKDTDWISVSDAAKLTGYHPEHITRLIRQGKLKARKIITVWQVSKSSLLAYSAQAEHISKKRGPRD